MTGNGFTQHPLLLCAIALVATLAILSTVTILTPADPRVFGPMGGIDPADVAEAAAREIPPPASRTIAYARPSVDERIRLPDGTSPLAWRGALLHGGYERCPAARRAGGVGAFHFRIERGVLTTSGDEVLAGEALTVLPRWTEQRSGVNFVGPEVALAEEPWIGVLVDGAITHGGMTDGQLRTLVDLVLALERRGWIDGPRVRLHDDLEPCGCPGGGLVLEEIERWLAVAGS